MFGDFYPNPGDATVSVVSLPLAMFAEGFGTFLLALFIFALTEDCNVGRPSSDLQPVFIGLTVSSIIFFIAPLKQAGLNPARDLGPRIVAYLAGWGDAALPDAVGGWFYCGSAYSCACRNCSARTRSLGVSMPMVSISLMPTLIL